MKVVVAFKLSQFSNMKLNLMHKFKFLTPNQFLPIYSTTEIKNFKIKIPKINAVTKITIKF